MSQFYLSEDLVYNVISHCADNPKLVILVGCVCRKWREISRAVYSKILDSEELTLAEFCSDGISKSILDPSKISRDALILEACMTRNKIRLFELLNMY
jgi:hypothetical protein